MHICIYYLAIIDKRERPQHPHALHGAGRAQGFVQLEHVDGVVVAAQSSVRVGLVRVLRRTPG